MKKTELLCILIFIGAIFRVDAQDCAVKLREAENLFAAGLVEDVPVLLEDCLRSGFNRAEEHTAYQLIIRSYLYEDKIEKAGSTMLEFLKKNPEYELSPTDNADFAYLFRQFSVKPVIQLSAHAGANMTFVSVIESFSTSGNPGKKNYENERLSIAAGLETRIKINSYLELGAGIDYSELTFRYTEPYLGYAEAIYPEKQVRVEIPASVCFLPRSFNGFTPYVRAGMAASFNVSTIASMSSENVDANNIIPRTGQDEDRTELRKLIEPVILAGAGCRYKLPMSYIYIDISARLGTLDQYSGGLPSNSEFFYGITDDRFRINCLRFSLGYTYIFYKPFKKEE